MRGEIAQKRLDSLFPAVITCSRSSRLAPLPHQDITSQLLYFWLYLVIRGQHRHDGVEGTLILHDGELATKILFLQETCQDQQERSMDTSSKWPGSAVLQL